MLSALCGLLALLALVGWMPPQPEPPVPDLSVYPWLVLRDGRPPAPDETAVELVIVGDLMLGRGVSGRPDPLADVASWLRAADLALGNLEGVITEATPTPSEASAESAYYLLPMPPSAAARLSDAGFDILSLANNHALDFGGTGLNDTVASLQAAGIEPLGVTAAADVDVASQPVIRHVDGVRLAFLAFNYVPYPARADLGGLPAEERMVADWDQERALAAIAAASVQADAVIVSMHWGYEYEYHPDPAQRTAAEAMLGAGADLVVGHHPHVVQGTAAYGRDIRLLQETRIVGSGDGFVAYSLGNFVFDQQGGETGQGLALRVFFDREGVRAVQALPVWAGPRPRLMHPAQAEPLLTRLNVPSRRLGFACVGDTPRLGTPAEAEASPTSHSERSEESLGNRAEVPHCASDDATAVAPRAQENDTDPACYPVEVPWVAVTGPFEAGSIDLTGDGLAEQVRLIDNQIIVQPSFEVILTTSTTTVSLAHELWRSPPDWRVVDVALGDPNDDGRGEIMLAMWKPVRGQDATISRPSHDEGLRPSHDEGLRPSHDEGLRSHPFIIGYREGVFRTLWGGSAAVRPLREIELGDVDGDGTQELIVLEEGGPDGERTVAVWGWHGWGFSLMHRSPPGCYHDLVLMAGQGGTAALISVAE